MSFLEGTIARLQLGRQQERQLERQADILAGKAVTLIKQVANEFPKSETAMAAKLALLCQKNNLQPTDLINELLNSGRHAELIETAKIVSFYQGVGPVDENGDIRVETSEDVVPMARLLLSLTDGLTKVDPANLDELAGMYENYTANNPHFTEHMYRNTAETMIYEAKNQNVLI